jgi:hypothetical protein
MVQRSEANPTTTATTTTTTAAATTTAPCKPMSSWLDRHPQRGAQQQPSPPHSGRGHSTAYTHRHFPLPSLVQGRSDDHIAPAQAPNPHMPQAHVSLRNCSQITPPLRSSTSWPRRRPTSHDLPPQDTLPYCAHSPTPLLGVRQLSHALHCPAPAHENSTTCAFPSAEVPARQIPTAPVELCIPAHPKLQRDHRPNDGRNTRFHRPQSPHCPLLFLNSSLDRPSCSSQNISLFALRGHLFWRYKISQQHRGPRRHLPCQFQPHLLLAGWSRRLSSDHQTRRPAQ